MKISEKIAQSINKSANKAALNTVFLSGIESFINKTFDQAGCYEFILGALDGGGDFFADISAFVRVDYSIGEDQGAGLADKIRSSQKEFKDLFGNLIDVIDSPAARVLVTVSGGVASCISSGDVEVHVFDCDNFNAGDEDDYDVPESFSELAAEAGIDELEGKNPPYLGFR